MTQPDPVPRALVGDNAPSVRPGDDPALYGTATLEPTTPAEVRSYRTYRIAYTVGRLGLDDTGAIRVAFRIVTDAGRPQITDPAGANYVSAMTTGAGRIVLRAAPEGQRPWTFCVTAQLRGGYLREGDRIVLTFGDTSQGGPGMLMQTFAEPGYELRVSSDVQATGNFEPLPEQFAFAIVPGPPARWRAVLPTRRRPGAPFRLGIKAEDAHSNPTHTKARLRLTPSFPVEGLPSHVDHDGRSTILDDLTAGPGLLRIAVAAEGGACEAGPLLIDDGTPHHWGDLHAQTGETVGVTRIEDYFAFARDLAFLDVASHQANDFQITPAFWTRLNEFAAEWDEPGRFTVLPGYEWSGNTAVGGDHNVFFAEEGRQIARCSHALLEDRTQTETDAHTLTDLFAAMRGTDTVIYGHVGGRYCDIHYDHDPVLETAVEVHSAWGSFEWVLTDGFATGRRVGVVCNSDGHKGRPGAEYPGASEFGAMGGLTCFLAERNDRRSIMEAQRRRHHYGTTGCRMMIDLMATLPEGSQVYERDPNAVPDAARAPARTALMGDIVAVAGDAVDLSLRIEAHAGIERVDILRGAETHRTVRSYGADDLGARIRVLWAGAEYRGRGRDTRWAGRAAFESVALQRIQPINRWHPERVLERRASAVIFEGVTTGTFAGFDAWTSGTGGRLRVETNRGTLDTDLGDLGLNPAVLEAGGLGRRLTVQRLPADPLPRRLSAQLRVPLSPSGDTPIWLRVTTEDGHRAWTSPIYAFHASV